MCVCVCVCACACTHAHTCVCVCVHAHARTHARVCVCVRACMRACVCVSEGESVEASWSIATLCMYTCADTTAGERLMLTLLSPAVEQPAPHNMQQATHSPDLALPPSPPSPPSPPPHSRRAEVVVHLLQGASPTHCIEQLSVEVEAVVRRHPQNGLQVECVQLL